MGISEPLKSIFRVLGEGYNNMLVKVLMSVNLIDGRFLQEESSRSRTCTHPICFKYISAPSNDRSRMWKELDREKTGIVCCGVQVASANLPHFPVAAKEGKCEVCD